MPMTDQEKSDLVHYLTKQNVNRKQPINYFIQRPLGTFGRPKLTDAEVRSARAQARRNKEVAELTTVATHPWDRRPDESARQYRAFCQYRDMGPDRTYKDVPDMAINSPWPKLYQWAQRVRAYDEYEEKRLRKVAERARKEMVERQARLGQTMTGLAQRSLDAGAIIPETVADVVRLAESGTRIERLARGESTENVANAHALILAHPLPKWAQGEEVKRLVQESVYDDGNESGTEPTTIDGDAGAVNK